MSRLTKAQREHLNAELRGIRIALEDTSAMMGLLARLALIRSGKARNFREARRILEGPKP